MGRLAMTVAALTATALVALAATASAGTKVSGVGEFNATCIPPQGPGAVPGDTGTYDPLDLTGNLDGCWYTYVLNAQSQPSGTYQETGTELFVGCLNGTTCGSFETTYTFTAKFAPSGAEIHGRCQHAITDGIGGFAGMSGVINFKDDVDAGLFYYRGNIHS